MADSWPQQTEQTTQTVTTAQGNDVTIRQTTWGQQPEHTKVEPPDPPGER